MRYAYPCVLTPEKNGGYSVSFPNVPEALTSGDDRDEALAMAEDALAVALGSYMQCREDIPMPDAAAGEQEMIAVPWSLRRSSLSTLPCESRGLRRSAWRGAWA